MFLQVLYPWSFASFRSVVQWVTDAIRAAFLQSWRIFTRLELGKRVRKRANASACLVLLRNKAYARR